MQHIHHHIDAKRETVVKYELVRVKFILATCACFPGDENYNPPNQVKYVKDAQDLVSQFKLVTLHVAKKDMKDYEAEVVRHGLKSGQRANIL